MNKITIVIGDAEAALEIPSGVPVTVRYPGPVGSGEHLFRIWDALTTLNQKVETMSDKTDNLTNDMAALRVAVDSQVSEIRTLATRVDDLNKFKDDALAAAEAGAAAATSERDAAVIELAAIKAAAVAVPADTTALEAQIEALTATLRDSTAFTAALDTMPAPPVEPAPVAVEPAPPAEPVPVVTDPAAPVVTDPAAPVAVDPAAPVATDPAVPAAPAVDPSAPTGVELTPTTGT